MNKRKADGLGFLLRCVLGGIVLGSIIGIFIGLNGFDADIFLAVAITLIAVILMGLCLYPLIANLKNDLIRKKGIRVEAEIAEVVDIIASPLYYQQGNNGELITSCDMACIPAMYVLRLVYTVKGKNIEREFPPTLERTAAQLLPYRMQKGETLPVICLPQKPQWAVIAIPGLLEETFEIQKNTVKYGILAALLVAGIYLVIMLNL